VPKKKENLWWVNEKIAKIFNTYAQKHFMALNIQYLLEGIPKSCWVSGFLILTKDFLIWMTAGHVLKKLEELFQNDKVRVIKSRWIDNYSDDAAKCIVCDYEDIKKFIIDDIDGYDLGFVVLRQFYADQILKVKESVPLTEAHWKLDEFEAEGYYLVGIPEEFTESKQIWTNTSSFDFMTSSTLVSIPLVKENPIVHQSENDFWTKENNFYGQVCPIRDDSGNLLKDISGMSGGPIFAVRNIDDNKHEYRIIALQSGWLQRKYVRGTCFNKIIEPLNKVLQKAVSEV